MNAIAQRTVHVLDKLNEAEMEEDIAHYDEAKLNDDGYRISSKNLRAKYGL